jgi:N-acetylglucosamine kinase-like BadF-type ATPase
MATALRLATEEALSMAGLSIEQIAGAGFGIGGYDWPSQEPQMVKTIRRAIGIQSPIAVCNDAVLGLLAGTEVGWGVALVAGTSCNCRGRDPRGREGRVTGDGHIFGEYGGAGELVDRALHAVVAEWSKRGPTTRLSSALVGYVGAQNVEEMLEGMSLGRYHLRAAAAPLVFQVAEAGDAVAREVIAWAGRELGDLAVGVIRQLGFEEISFDVVLVGSLFNGGPLFTEPVRETIHGVAPNAHLHRLTAPPVIGGVLLGMKEVGVDRTGVRQMLLKTTSQPPVTSGP